MLQEFTGQGMKKKDPNRRWFRGDRIELIVWYNKDNSISGFQLCYKKENSEKALTWKKETGFTHDTIDSGETVPTDYKQTPILVPDGIFEKDNIAELFVSESRELEKQLTEFVLEKIREY